MKRREPAITEDDPTGWERWPTIRGFAVVVATLIGLYICYQLARPFLAALTWALTIGVLAAPVHRRLERRLKHPNLAAAASVVWLALIVVIPLTFMAQQLWKEVGSGAAALQQQFADGNMQRTIDGYPVLGSLVDMIERQIDLRALMGSFATWLTNFGKYIVQGSLSHAITILVAFYVLFYFLRDRQAALRQVKNLSPLTDGETERLLHKVSDTIHAMIFGTVVTAVIQGILGGAMFWILGLPNPVFWGLVMALLAVVPVLGTFVIWIPAAIYLTLSGEWGKAVILAGWGGVVIAGIDNILYPILAGGHLRMHTVPMFISIVGGLMLFGAAGVILGPVAVTVTITLVEIWRARAHVKKAA